MDHTAIGVFDNVDTSKKANEKPVQIHFIDASSCTEVYPNETLPTEELGIVPVDPFQRGKDEVQILEDGIKQVHFVDASSSTEVYPNEILFTEEVEIVTVDPFPKENNEITILEDDIKQIHFIDASSSTEDCSSEALHNEEPENVPVDPFQKEEKEIKVLEDDIKETVIVEDLTGCKLEKIQNDTLLQPEDGISDPLKCNLKLEENKSLKLEDKKPIEKDCDSKLKDQGTQTDIFVDQACQTDPEGSFLNPFTEEDSVLAEGSVITREQENVSGHSLGNNKGSKTFQTSAGSLTLSIAPAYNTSTPKNLPKTCQKRPSMIKESPELKKGHVSGLTLVSDKSKNTLQIMNTSGGLALKTAACKSLPKTFNKSVMEVKASSDLEKVTELNEEMEDPLLDDDEQHFMDFDIDIKEEIDCLEIETLPKEDGKPKCLPLHKNQSEASEKITSEHVPSSDPKIKQYGRGRQDNNCISQTSSLKKIAVNQKYSKKENLYGFTIVKNMNYNKTLEIEGDSLFSSNVLVLDTATPTSLPETCKESVMKVKASPALEKYGGKCHKNKSVSQPSLSKKNAVHLKPKPKKKKKVGEISLNLNRRNMTLQIVEDSPFSKGLLDPDTVFHKPATKTYKKKCKAKSSSESEKEPGQSCNIPPVANINIPSTASVTSFTLKNPLDVFESDSGPVFSPLDNDFNHLSTLSDYSATIHQEPKARSISFAVAGTSSTGDSIASSITTVAGKSAGKDVKVTTGPVKAGKISGSSFSARLSELAKKKSSSFLILKPVESWPYQCTSCKKCFKTQNALSKHEVWHNSIKVKFYGQLPPGHKLSQGTYVCKVCFQLFETKFLFLRHFKTHPPHSSEKSFGKESVHKKQFMSQPSVTKRHVNEPHQSDSRDSKCDGSVALVNIKIQPALKNDNVPVSIGKTDCIQNDASASDKKTIDFLGIYEPNQKLSTSLLSNGNKKVLDLHTSSHLKQNEKKFMYSCKICRRSFSKKHMYYYHVKTHREGNQYKPNICEVCGTGFRFKKQLQAHARTHPKALPYKCDKCGKCVRTEFKLKVHLTAHHVVKQYSCPTCYKTFKQKESLSIHQATHHSNEKPFKCETCGKCFHCRVYLKSHQKIHSRPFLCKYCGKSFPKKYELVQHENFHIGILDKPQKDKKIFRCQVCNKLFSSKATFKNHMLRHSSLDHVCKTCDKPFSSLDELLVHERVHSGLKPYSCNFCDKSFCRKDALRKHKNVHLEPKPFQCKFCDKSFGETIVLLHHERVHTGEKPYLCEVCGKSFTTNQSLLTHQYVHTGEKIKSKFGKHICQTCGKDFPFRQKLIHHQLLHKGKNPYQCKACGKSHSSHSALYMHTKTHHKKLQSEEKQYVCKTCGKSFVSERNLKLHYETHSEERPFVCDVCGFSFKRKANLDTHIKGVHNGIKPYVCGECGKSFTQKTSLEVHIRTHTGEKPYACKTCGKCFSERKTLINHENTHLECKPFACSVCEKSFNQKNALTKHMNLFHSEIGEFICSYCDACFGNKNILAKHLQTHTK